MMRRSNFESFNPRLYEEGLSPLGRNVLNVLINQWNSERHRLPCRSAPYSNQRRFPGARGSNTKVLRFHDAHVTAPSGNTMFPPSPLPLYPPSAGAPPLRSAAFVAQDHNAHSIPNYFSDDAIDDSDVTTARNGDILILNDTHHRFDHIDGNGHNGYIPYEKPDLKQRSPLTNICVTNEAPPRMTYNKINNYSFDTRAHQIGNDINNLKLNTHETALNVRNNRIHGYDAALDVRTRINNDRKNLYTDDITPAADQQMDLLLLDKHTAPHNKAKVPRFDEAPDLNTGDSPPFEGIPIDYGIQKKDGTPLIGSKPTATVNELFKTVDMTSEKYLETDRDREYICREDLLNTPLIGNVRVNSNDKAGAIDWDDMFDTGLIAHEQVTNNMNIDARLPKDVPPKCRRTVKNVKVAVQKKSNSPKAPKRKVQTELTVALPKKVKKADAVSKVSKNPFRKDKFTTVVTNWLDGVDAAHDPEEAVTVTVKDNILVEEGKGKKKVSPKGKKIIQAQLTNKDGIMKYGKPSPNNSSNTAVTDTNNKNEGKNNMMTKKGTAKALSSTEYTEEENRTCGKLTEENKKGNAKKAQETSKTQDENKLSSTSSSTKETNQMSATNKKSKRKFVVPLKSQPSQSTPGDVESHDVRTVEAEDKELCALVPPQSQVVMMLMYSNGFCQANANYATREGHAVAVMVMVTSAAGVDTFYHVEGTEGAQTEVLKHIVEQCSIVCYDGKDLLKYLMVHLQLDVEHMELNVHDIKVAGSLLSPESPPESFAALQRLLHQPVTPCEGDARNKAASYAVRMRAACLLLDQLKDKGMWRLFTDIEMKVLPIIAAMEQRGVHVDTATLASLDKSLEQAVQSAEHACHVAAGRTFQVQSPAAIRAIIYEELKLDQLCNLKVKHTPAANDKSTSETMLKQLSSVHPLPRRILRHRQLHKVRATFVAGIQRHTHNHTLKPTWLQCSAATGRIACAYPNLQALPKHPVYLDEDDDECVMYGDDDPRDTDDDDCADLADADAVDYLHPTISSEAAAVSSGCRALSVRSVVSSGSEDMVLLAADYQHLECRLLAHAAQDQRLLAALTAPDLFKELAMHWLKKPVSSVSVEERERCKRMVYAAAYGCGSARLQELLGDHHQGTSTSTSAQDVLNSFNNTFPSISNFARVVVSRCSAAGGVIRLQSGRQRSLPDINSNHSGKRARATRQAVNFTIQGAAADLCKLSMVRSVQALSARGVHAQLLLTVHDELVWTLPRHQLAQARAVVQQAMEGCGEELGGPTMRLPVAMRSGPHWGNMAPL